MASNINLTSIDTAYPVAGQDNDSQGFRDNFSNINSNFTETKTEVEDLQSKVILKSALTGASLDNDMDNAEISAAKMVDTREKVVSHTSTENPLNLSIVAGSYHTITPNASFTLAFSDGTSADWPTTGNFGKVRLEVTFDSVSKTMTLPSSVSIGQVTGQSGQVVTVPTTGTYVYELSTRDGGTTVHIKEVNTDSKLTPEYRTIASSVGASGDVKGMVAVDATSIYLCTADYDGATDIWVKQDWTDTGSW